MENHWLTKRETKGFLAVLAQFFDVHETGRHGLAIIWHNGEKPDFTFLYAKYPRVKTGIEQAVQRLLLMREQCHA